jgi:hypothetical protein
MSHTLMEIMIPGKKWVCVRCLSPFSTAEELDAHTDHHSFKTLNDYIKAKEEDEAVTEVNNKFFGHVKNYFALFSLSFHFILGCFLFLGPSELPTRR